MILVTHAIVGGAIGKFLPNNPILAFCAGFLSHFAIDAIPHWIYPLFSWKHDPGDSMHDDMLLNKWFIVDLFNIGIDFFAGITLSLIFFHPQMSFDLPLIPIIAGAIGGITPDILAFLYWKLPNKPLMLLNKFHLWIHYKTGEVSGQHIEGYALGISTQVLFAAAVIVLTRWLAR